MTHHHDHHHDAPQMSFEDKMIKLLDHWNQHNKDHAETYQEWAKKAKENYLIEISALLDEVAEMTLAINEKFEEASEFLKD